jgi:Ca2+-transporting ATPase
VLALLVAIFLVTLRNADETEARAMTFATLVIANLALILVNRSSTRSILETIKIPNRALWWVTGGALVFLGLVLYIAELRSLFRLAYLHVDDVAIVLAVGIGSVAWLEIAKAIRRRFVTRLRRAR